MKPNLFDFSSLRLRAVSAGILTAFAVSASAQFSFTSNDPNDGPSNFGPTVTCYANGSLAQSYCGPTGFPGGTAGDMLFQGRDGASTQPVVALGGDSNLYLSYGPSGNSTTIGSMSRIIIYNYVTPSLYWSGVSVYQSSGSDQTVTVRTFSDTGLANQTSSTSTVVPSGAKTSVAFSPIQFAAAEIAFPSNLVWGANDFLLNTVAVQTSPGAPAIGAATAGDAGAVVTFTPPASDGGASITGYKATSAPADVVDVACAGSPCTITGLSNGTAYTFTIVATNSAGDSVPSAASNSVTPLADTDGDGVPDISDSFPSDPVESADADADGIGDNGDAGGAGLGVVLSGVSGSCTFNGPVTTAAVSPAGAPGTPIDTELGFQIDGCGSPVQISAKFGSALPAGSIAYKRSAAGVWTAIPGAVVSGDTVTYSITDGGPLDADGSVNGSISDPVTALVPFAGSGTQQIPALPLWAYMLLIGLMSVIARNFQMQRRSAR